MLCCSCVDVFGEVFAAAITFARKKVEIVYSSSRQLKEAQFNACECQQHGVVLPVHRAKTLLFALASLQSPCHVEEVKASCRLVEVVVVRAHSKILPVVRQLRPHLACTF
ncbi:unnamed protein product [Cercospora beticola]|nr:unnamed protein product [Cercospora beticola]